MADPKKLGNNQGGSKESDKGKTSGGKGGGTVPTTGTPPSKPKGKG